MNHDLIAATMSRNAVLLGALSHVLSLDLAVAPLVLAREPGIGTLTTLRGIARGMDMGLVEVRCAQVEPRDIAPDGPVGADMFGKDRPLLVVLDEATSGATDVVETMLATISEAATAPVVVVLAVGLGDEDEAIELVGRTLGIPRALVPSARLAVSTTPKQPVLITGSLSLEGSKRGERYFEIEASDPTEARVNFTLEAFGDQGDDDLNAFLQGFEDRGQVAVRLERTRDGLTCTTADMASCK